MNSYQSQNNVISYFCEQYGLSEFRGRQGLEKIKHIQQESCKPLNQASAAVLFSLRQSLNRNILSPERERENVFLLSLHSLSEISLRDTQLPLESN